MTPPLILSGGVPLGSWSPSPGELEGSGGSWKVDGAGKLVVAAPSKARYLTQQTGIECRGVCKTAVGLRDRACH